MAIYFQEEKLTFLQKKEDVNEKQLGENEPIYGQACPYQSSGSFAKQLLF